MTAFFARFRERLKRARRRCFVPPAAEVAFFAVTLAVAGAVFLIGCADIEIPSEDPFFKVGHTYETSEEHILIYRVGSRIWDDYERWGVLEPIPEDEKDVKEMLPTLRKWGAMIFDGHSQFYRGIFIYVPAGTKFKVDKTYYNFLQSLELGKGLTYDITLLGDLAKHGHVYFVDYDMVRAKDITADAKRLK